MVASWILQAACYFGLLTCSTPPGTWPSAPTVIASTPPSRVTSTTSAAGTATATPSLTSSSTTLVTSSTMSLTSSSVVASPTATAIAQGSVLANILVIARDSASAKVASSGLNGYGIPFTTLLVPQSGVQLPALNSSSGGNFGGIVVAGEVSYDYGNTTGYQSALTTDQWNQLYAYQLAYGVRMVQYDVYPGPNFGATAVGGGCCDTGVEQLISFSDTSDFATSGLRTGAGVSTQGLWHYPATISNTTTTKEIAKFAANSVTSGETTAAVINNFSGREQMAFFIGFDTTWSATSNYLQHAWITWITRGLYAGHRRVNLNTQIDDMFLETDIYYPNGTIFRITTKDMDGIANWIPTITAKMNAGSSYFVEVGHNGNGNLEASSSTDAGYTACNGGGIEYDSPPDTPLEWVKPLGTGTNLWPATPTSYNWTTACTQMDDLLLWWTTVENRDKFGHISHTFTHLEQNNATYSDVVKEISFNQAWLKQTGLDTAKYFTANGIIPPAITGLHNGDALRAWWENGIKNCVGDNTRPALLNTQNDMWPYFTTTAADNFDGMQVNPRWATRIYYNCDTPACTVQEWIDTSAGSGDFQTLLDTEKADTMRHLFGLHHDPYMFHQANLRNADTTPITVNGVSGQYSIFQAWVETQVQEFVRLVEWPLVTVTHADMSAGFLSRYNRDQCNYSLSYAIANKQITGVTVSANGNTCSEPIPVTFPVAPTSTLGFTTEQLGSDPLTVWAQLSGSPVTFTLSTPIAL
ncbi:extracellular serine-rich protein [Aspergillus terreus]|uniref:Extracellular serine-rich protein n=1 Tax=Aspergillus terreus TaxID=33178 RepID=A0A5M3YML2_ASPTE|nr:hypothetical protein ATETN484_0001081700 [Aspergillus terreus]GFF12672.1 extracellular serine-rich protein [Aspergillus terreus]